MKLLERSEAMSLKVQHLTGGYTRFPVIHDVSFEIDQGEMLGLIGLNGAGKSTIVKHIIGLMTAKHGLITLNDKSLADEPEAYLKQIAYIPETPILYPELTLREHLEITGMAYDMSKNDIRERSEPLLKMFRLDQRLDWFPEDFSKGMKQKVMLVCAFMRQANLYVIDEPFIGLDPVAIFDLEKILLKLKEEGARILMTTHVLANAEKLCDRFVFLNQGKIISQGTVAEMREDLGLIKGNLEDFYLQIARKAGHDNEL